MSYTLRIASFSDGSTTFDATAAGVSVKDGPAEGPAVITHLATNDAGAIIDLDGTGPATLVPPLMTFNLIFDAANPAAHAQFNNLVALKGKHGTFTGRLPGASSNSTSSAAARLVEIRGTWQPPFKIGTFSRLVVAVDFQLKGFL